MEGSSANFVSFLPIILIFALMYFLIIRPQNKKAKEHQAMVKALGKGDRVVMNGGIIGTVSKIISDTELEIDLEGSAKARALRSMVASVLTGSTAVSAPSSSGAKTAFASKKPAPKARTTPAKPAKKAPAKKKK
jgi:preprotein translocase subunit YajC